MAIEFKRKEVENPEINVTVNVGSQVKIPGQPFPFSGRIVECYYSNPELDTVSIMWSDGEKNREYYLKVDESDAQFQALLSEYSYESIDECTRNRHEIHRQEFREAFHDYAMKNNMFSSGGHFMGAEEYQGSMDLMFEFDPEDASNKESLFKLKLKIFEQDEVKNSKKKKGKTDIRKAETPVEAISAYYSFLK
jgi:hypothetical protein